MKLHLVTLNSTNGGAKANLTEGISLNNLTPSSSSSSSSSYLISSHILNLTQEVFIEICENLPPKDLYTLTLVYLKPPGDLSEQKFVWLLDIGETCQYCGKKIIIGSEERRLFWEFKVLVCSNCAQKQTISFEKLRESENYSEEDTMEPIHIIGKQMYLVQFDEEAWDQCRGNVEKLVNKILQITGQPKWNHKELV
ncbi:unnamed protein product [Rhizophagus irregularis]|nr:unnamed protein product [Rhizophagus irregularis]